MTTLSLEPFRSRGANEKFEVTQPDSLIHMETRQNKVSMGVSGLLYSDSEPVEGPLDLSSLSSRRSELKSWTRCIHFLESLTSYM